MPNVLKMVQTTDHNKINSIKGINKPNSQNGKNGLKKIELATLIQSAPAPYEKTKILRIVHRYVLIN